ncbi:hypothetical protein Pelo_2050 [Pelomyxa schiedti]|nr:hypothetical protein Pelo_2050 [Pelomyxa schiedti]
MDVEFALRLPLIASPLGDWPDERVNAPPLSFVHSALALPGELHPGTTAPGATRRGATPCGVASFSGPTAAAPLPAAAAAPARSHQPADDDDGSARRRCSTTNLGTKVAPLLVVVAAVVAAAAARLICRFEARGGVDVMSTRRMRMWLDANSPPQGDDVHHSGDKKKSWKMALPGRRFCDIHIFFCLCIYAYIYAAHLGHVQFGDTAPSFYQHNAESPVFPVAISQQPVLGRQAEFADAFGLLLKNLSVKEVQIGGFLNSLPLEHKYAALWWLTCGMPGQDVPLCIGLSQLWRF